MSALLWSDGNQMLLKNWAAQEMNIEKNHCGYINGTDGKWYLDKCANGKNYVCKTTTGKSGYITLHKRTFWKGYNLSFGNQEALQDQFKMAKDIVWPAMMTWYLRATSATEFPRPKETPTKRRQSFGVRQKWTAGIYKQLSGVHYEKLYSIMVHNF